MTLLRRHLIVIVAGLFVLAVGIALGGGPLSYVSNEDGDGKVAADSSPGAEVGDDDDEAPQPPADNAFADAFAIAAATRLYDAKLLGHPTVILAMPGADPDLVTAMTQHVAAAGGGLTGVFALSDLATDLGQTSQIDTVGSQLMTQLADPRIDPAAPTYVRFGQLVGLAMATPAKGGIRADPSAEAIRTNLTTAGLLTVPPTATRLAPLLLTILPADDAIVEGELATASVYTGIAIGLATNVAGVVVLGDTASATDGLLATLRKDADLTGTVASVDGSDTTIGQVTAMLALIGSLNGSVGAYGASGSDGAVPIS